MLGSARSLLRRLEEGATVPPTGTGPHGAPGRTRWVTAEDVLAWNGNRAVPNPSLGLHNATDTRLFSSTPVPLRSYQTECVEACVGRSGIVNMECGTGKSYVGTELVRRSHGPCLVLAQHAQSVEQWVDVLRRFAGARVQNIRHLVWRLNDPLPDVVVATYAGVVRTLRLVQRHREALETDGAFLSHTAYTTPAEHLVSLYLCVPLATLVFDEVHSVVSDYFALACALRCNAVYGLSGSLVREDERIVRLATTVGPVRFRYGMQRTLRVVLVTVPTLEVMRHVASQTVLALNPHKVAALRHVLLRHRDERVIVFTDTVQSADALKAYLSPRGLILKGVCCDEERTYVLRRFRDDDAGTHVLVCTRIADASIDFPSGCVVVQYHKSSGSRQQETQRCGRGTRGTTADVCMYHIVNAETTEVEFTSRRLTHLVQHMAATVTIAAVTHDVTTTTLDDEAPLRSLTRITIPPRKAITTKRPRLLRPRRL
jgi:superfamily II DNA or RNA helicase